MCSRVLHQGPPSPHAPHATPPGCFARDSRSYLVGDSATFCATFQVIRETCSFTKTPAPLARAGGHHAPKQRSAHHHGGASGGECLQGRFVWRVEGFTKLKDALKKRKVAGLCIRSRRFQVGGHDCRLIVYPRGQSNPPNHLSMFLEVTDPRAGPEWSCFVSHRLSVVNQKGPENTVSERSVSKARGGGLLFRSSRRLLQSPALLPYYSTTFTCSGDTKHVPGCTSAYYSTKFISCAQ